MLRLSYPLPPSWAPGCPVTLAVPVQHLPPGLAEGLPRDAPAPLCELLICPPEERPLVSDGWVTSVQVVAWHWLMADAQALLRRVLWPSASHEAASLSRWARAWRINTDPKAGQLDGLRVALITISPDNR